MSGQPKVVEQIPQRIIKVTMNLTDRNGINQINLITSNQNQDCWMFQFRNVVENKQDFLDIFIYPLCTECPHMEQPHRFCPKVPFCYESTLYSYRKNTCWGHSNNHFRNNCQNRVGRIESEFKIVYKCLPKEISFHPVARQRATIIIETSFSELSVPWSSTFSCLPQI